MAPITGQKVHLGKCKKVIRKALLTESGRVFRLGLLFFLILNLTTASWWSLAAINLRNDRVDWLPGRAYKKKIIFSAGVIIKKDLKTERGYTKDLHNSEMLSQALLQRRSKFKFDQDLNSMILDEGSALDLRQQYLDLNRNYEFRKNYKLVGLADEDEQQNKMRTFSDDILSSVRHFQEEKARDKAIDIAKKDKNLWLLATSTPAKAAFFLYAAGTGRPYRMTLAEDTYLESKTDVPDQKASFSLLSGYLSGTFSWNVVAPNDLPEELKSDNIPDDRYNFSLSRSIPVVNLNSSLGFGTTTKTVKAEVSRKIVHNLEFVVDTSRSIDSRVATARPGQEKVQLRYGFNF